VTQFAPMIQYYGILYELRHKVAFGHAGYFNFWNGRTYLNDKQNRLKLFWINYVASNIVENKDNQMSPKQFRFHVIYRNLCFVFVALGILFTLTFLITAVTNAAPLMHSNEGHNYYVQYGDTLSEIAQMHGLSTAELRRANALSNADHIHSGDILYIPSTSSQHGQSCRYHHEVSSGQSLSWIAVSYGIDIASLAQANHIHDYDNIKFGQSLCIPVYNSTPNTPAPKTIPTTAPTPVPTIYVPPTSTVNPLSYYPEPNGYVYYTLRLGDTLGTLASRYQTTEHHITVLNPTANIAIGTILLLPIYDEIPAPPTQTPLFYPTIISMSPTQTPLFYPTLVPPPATTIPVATTTPVPPSATQPSAATPLVPTATPLVPTIIRPPATTMPPTAMPPPTSTSLPTAILPPTTTPILGRWRARFWHSK